MRLFGVALSGTPTQTVVDRGATDDGSHRPPVGVVGLDVRATEVDGDAVTVVQLLLDDDEAGFDPTLLDGPIVAEVLDHDEVVMLREPFDHDSFRRQLLRERAAGESVTRGVLVLTEGEPPPPWVRLAFLPVALAATDGATLVVRRTSVDELIDGVEVAFGRGAMTEAERRTVLASIEQRHPPA